MGIITTLFGDPRLAGSKLRRSSKWPATRLAHLKANPTCAVCGSSKALEVHHIKPFHLFPELEREKTNLITLCEGKSCNCHITFGHFGNWQDWNPDVVEMCREYSCRKSQDRSKFILPRTNRVDFGDQKTQEI